jgi:hypothetical protein
VVRRSSRVLDLTVLGLLAIGIDLRLFSINLGDILCEFLLLEPFLGTSHVFYIEERNTYSFSPSSLIELHESTADDTASEFSFSFLSISNAHG